MSKYKRNIKLSRSVITGIIIICILLFTSVGYSLWKDYLYINIDIGMKYKEPKLENVVVTDYSDFYADKNEDYGVKALKRVSSKVTDEDTLEIYAEFSVGAWVVIGRDVDVFASFTNNNGVPLTDGKYELLEKTLDYDIEFTIPETVGVNEDSTMNIRYYIRSSMKPKTGIVKYKVSYRVGEVKRYIYFTLNIVRA